jgi:predicted lysophospholipase L1 biosynthesis ABC-type transport system permease subunit
LLGRTGQVPVNALVRLRDESPPGIEAFRADLTRVSGRSDIEMLDQVESAAKARDTLGFESAALLAFGLAALAAALVLVGQAVARYVAATVVDLRSLRAIGMERRTTLAAATTPAVLAGTVGILVGVGLAVAVSPLFPLGNAVILEPAPGVDVDPLVLGAGGLLLVLLLVAGAVGAGLSALGAGGDGAAHRSAAAALAARAGLPVPVLVGLRFALEPGRGRTALPVRPAIIGAVVGVLGVLAAVTFSTGVAEATANPDRFGQTHRIETFTGFDGADFGPDIDALVATTVADPDVTAVADAPIGVLDAGTGPVTVFSYGSHGARPFPTVALSGRMPAAPDEILLGPATAAELHVGVGGRIPATGNRGTAELTVTGVGFVPYAGHNNYDDGGWLTPDGYTALVEGFKFHVVYVALRPGADPRAVADRLNAASGAGFEVTPPMLEAELLRAVETLPLALGAFLAVLAVGAVGHALATAVRRRRHDVAVLRALGMTRWQTRGVVVTQATALAVIGLLFGVPLGVAVGRLLWRVVADFTPLQYQAPVALLALLLAAPVAVLLANALAAWPGRRAAGLRIATVLRAE